MDDFEIEFFEENQLEDNVDLPANLLLIGEIHEDDVKIFIHQKVYKALEEYAVSDIHRELGTILLGNFSVDAAEKNVVISHFIYAKYTDSSEYTLTFTHKTWDYVYKEQEKNYPDTKIVGWQHTHPGYGIFLSNYDMFIQENFFNLEFQVAYVIDPKQKIRGFFQWKNGEVCKLKGFYIYDEPDISIDMPEQDENM